MAWIPKSVQQRHAATIPVCDDFHQVACLIIFFLATGWAGGVHFWALVNFFHSTTPHLRVCSSSTKPLQVMLSSSSSMTASWRSPMTFGSTLRPPKRLIKRNVLYGIYYLFDTSDLTSYLVSSSRPFPNSRTPPMPCLQWLVLSRARYPRISKSSCRARSLKRKWRRRSLSLAIPSLVMSFLFSPFFTRVMDYWHVENRQCCQQEARH